MKKTVALFLVFLILFSGGLFAVPTPGAYFSDVHGEELSDTQMDAVDGEGFFSFFSNAILGAIVGGVISSVKMAMNPNTDYSDPAGAANRILGSMLDGALGGITVSFMIPF